MKLDRQARNFASGLFRIAQNADAIEAVDQALSILHDLLKSDTTFKAFFVTHRVSVEKKTDILRSILGKSIHPIALEFFLLVMERRAHRLFSQIVVIYERMTADFLERVDVTVYSADELPGDTLRKIETTLASVLKETPRFQSKVDEALIGGIKLRVGNTYLDASIASQLEQMRQDLVTAQ